MLSTNTRLVGLALFLTLAAMLSGCATQAQVDPASVSLPAATRVAPTQPMATITPVPPQGLVSAPEAQPEPVLLPGASQTTQSENGTAASATGSTAQMEAQYLAMALANEATQVLLSATQDLAAGAIEQAEAMAMQAAMEMVIESAEEVLGVEISDNLTDEQLEAAMEIAEQALPVVLETMAQLEEAGVTPEQAAAQLEGALAQFEDAEQIAMQTMAQNRANGRSSLNTAQMERLRTRARAQTELALDAMRRRQQSGAEGGAANQLQQQTQQQLQQQGQAAAQDAANQVRNAARNAAGNGAGNGNK